MMGTLIRAHTLSTGVVAFDLHFDFFDDKFP